MNNLIKNIIKKYKMKQLVIDENKAKEAYKTASPEFKTMLEDTFGKKFFQGNIMDRIKTFKDVCEEVGENYADFMRLIKNLPLDEQGYKKCKLIVKALNEGWEPDWKDSNEYKYFPYFQMNKKPGSGFGDSFYLFWCAYSFVSSRLALKSRDLALYASKTFEQEYYDYMVIQ